MVGAVSRQVPFNAEAEESLAGACLSTRSAWEHAIAMLVPDDFYVPACRHVFVAVSALAEHGKPITPATVGIWLGDHAQLDGLRVGDQTGRDALTLLWSQTPAGMNASHYARLIVEASSRRKLITAAHQITEAAYSMGEDIGDVIALAAEQVDRASLPVGGAPDLDVLAYVDSGVSVEEWVIPDLLARQERLLLVAQEGGGKSTVLRQAALMLSAGLHPFRWHPVPRQRCLLIDLENPQALLRRKLREMAEPLIARELGHSTAYDPAWLRICARTEGIDLAQRADQMWLAERVQANAQAMGGLDLLCIGPVYKMDFEAEEKDGATRVQDALAAIRRRHGCAVILETHAPHESFSSGKPRALRPSGSRQWLRWPEFCRGFEVHPEHPGCVDFYNVRPPRDERPWPRILRRDMKPWPWSEPGFPIAEKF